MSELTQGYSIPETRYEIIQSYIDKHNYTNYLEIGIHHPSLCFDKINIKNKVGVDPQQIVHPEILTGTSDKLFAALIENDNFSHLPSLKFLEQRKKFDIIFIDGLHIDWQVIRDIENSLEFLEEGGTIIMHDCLPSEVTYATDTYTQPIWFGTPWKAFVFMRMTRPDLTMFTINTDCGCGVIQRGNQELVPYEPHCKRNWELHKKNNREIMNVVSPKDWYDLHIV